MGSDSVVISCDSDSYFFSHFLVFRLLTKRQKDKKVGKLGRFFSLFPGLHKEENRSSFPKLRFSTTLHGDEGTECTCPKTESAPSFF